MGELTTTTAVDGHRLDVYVAAPSGAPDGAIVVIQEIFGLTAFVRRVADAYAALGFVAAAPAMFDRLERGLVLDYADVQTGRALMQRLQWPDTLRDVTAAAELAAKRGATAAGSVSGGKVSAARGTAAQLPTGIVGFCWGGTVAHVAAAELDVAVAVSYYGGAVVRMLDKRPRCPILYHFGDRDQAIPLADVERIRAAFPAARVEVYAGAGHGFACEDRQSYEPGAAALAFERSAAFVRSTLRRHA